MNKDTSAVLARLPSPLLEWFRKNARDLPWRRTEDPYRIWVSEIMLQQTRVAAVLDYYLRFLQAFPTVESLAAASEEQLFKLWEGLGYYSRARNMQKTAQRITDRYSGTFPRTHAELLTLPGIGDYTASAIASAAFGIPEPAVDGNVLRVFTRLTDCHENISDLKVKRAVREAVGGVLPSDEQDIRIFNQAAMELGAVICVPNGPPKCGLCPARDFCLGNHRGTAEALPVKSPRKARRTEDKTIFLLLREDGRIALRKRPKTGLLAGLWEFPNIPEKFEEAAVWEALIHWGLTPMDWLKKLSAKHIFTHVEWHMTGYSLRVSGSGPADFFWADARSFAECAIPSAFAKYTEEAKSLLNAQHKT